MPKERTLFSFTIISVIVVFLLQNILFVVDFNNGDHVQHLFNTIRLSLYGLLTFLCAIPVFLLQNKPSSAHRQHLKYAYLFLVTGTTLFIANECFDGLIKSTVSGYTDVLFLRFPHIVYVDTTTNNLNQLYSAIFFAIGNLFFYCMHLAFIVRHRNRKGAPHKVHHRFFLTALVLCTIMAFSIPLFIHWGYEGDIVTQQDIGWGKVVSNTSSLLYAGLIMTAIFHAYKTWDSKEYPRINSLLIIIGYTLFPFCELLVIIGQLFGDKLLLVKELSSAFYTPAFLFLALSGFDFSEKKQ